MISIDGFLAVYFSMRKPTAEDRHGARPPAVRMATFAYIGVGWRVCGVVLCFAREGVWGVCGYAFGAAAAAAWAGRDGADLGRICRPSATAGKACAARPTRSRLPAALEHGNGAARAVLLVRSGERLGMISAPYFCHAHCRQPQRANS